MEIPVRIYEEITGLAELPPPVDEADYERRKHRRVPFGHKAIISPERKGYDNTPAVVMVRDVSLSGVSFVNDESLKVGTPVLIEFKGHQDREVKLHCSVVRCEAGGSGGAQFVVGASFNAVLTQELPLGTPSGIAKPAEPAAQEPKHADASPAAAVPSMTLTEAKTPVGEQARVAEKSTKPEPAPQAAVPAPPAPVKPSALFKAADPTEAKKVTEEYWSDGQPTETAPQPATPKAAPELSTPVFRDVPLPDPEPELEQKPEPQPESEEEIEPEPGSELGTEPEPVRPEPVREVPKNEIQEKEIPEKEVPEKVVTVAAGPVRQTHEHHGKTHEVLARVKELLVVQEQSIERQRQELKEQRERFEKEIKSMRSELENTKAKLAEIRTKSDEDEDAIVELENFLKQHDRREKPGRKNEAA